MKTFPTLFFLLIIAGTAESQTPLRLPSFFDGYLDVSVKDNFSGFYDPSGQMSLSDVRPAIFVPLDSFQYPLGILRNNDCRVWLRCLTDSLSRSSADTTPLYWHFNLRHTLIEGFVVRENEPIEQYRWGQRANGEPLPTLFLLPFERSAQPKATWYFRIRPFPFRINNFSPSVMSMKGWRDRSAVRYYDMRLAQNFMVCLTGILLFVSLFTFMQWALYRRQVFLYYGCFLLSCLANFYRYESEFAVPVTKLTAFLTSQGDFITTYLGHTFYFLFINDFLRLQKHMPVLYKVTNSTAIFSSFLFIIHFIVYYLLNRHDWAVSIFLLRFPLLAVGVYALLDVSYKRPPFYIFILCGGLAVTVGAFIWMTSGYRLEHRLPVIPYAAVAFYLGVMLQTFFFLSGLGYQFKISELAKRKAQKNLLDERERITRDLHDDVGSTLNSLAVMSELARRQSNDLPVSVVEALETIQNTARDTVQRISDIVWSVNPNIDTVGDLVARMRNFTFSLFSGTDTRVRFSVSDTLETLPITPDRRWQLYLLFKEAVNNVSKYAAASLLRVEFEENNGSMRLTIGDNGKGFDPEQTHPGNGLRTMQERAQALGGAVQLHSAAGEGTVVEIDWEL